MAMWWPRSGLPCSESFPSQTSSVGPRPSTRIARRPRQWLELAARRLLRSARTPTVCVRLLICVLTLHLSTPHPLSLPSPLLHHSINPVSPSYSLFLSLSVLIPPRHDTCNLHEFHQTPTVSPMGYNNVNVNLRFMLIPGDTWHSTD